MDTTGGWQQELPIVSSIEQTKQKAGYVIPLHIETKFQSYREQLMIIA